MIDKLFHNEHSDYFAFAENGYDLLIIHGCGAVGVSLGNSRGIHKATQHYQI